MIGPPMAPNTIFDYQPTWPERFAELAAGIRLVVGDDAVRIDHIGSTSVPGLASKDVIDLQVTVADISTSAKRDGRISGTRCCSATSSAPIRTARLRTSA